MIVPPELRDPCSYFDYQPENRFLHIDPVELSAGRFTKIADIGHMVILSKEDDGSRSFYLIDPLLIRVDEFISLSRHLVSLENFNGLVKNCRARDSHSITAYNWLQTVADTHRLSIQQIYALVGKNYAELFEIDGGVGIGRLLLEPWP